MAEPQHQPLTATELEHTELDASEPTSHAPGEHHPEERPAPEHSAVGTIAAPRFEAPGETDASGAAAADERRAPEGAQGNPGGQHEAEQPERDAASLQFDPGVDPDGQMAGRLNELKSAGLMAFDAIGVTHVQRLLERAASIDGVARERLVHRAQLYLESLEFRRQQALSQAAREVERLEQLELDPLGRARAALERGDVIAVKQMARRLPQTAPRLRDRVRKQWEAALDAEVEKRGLSSPGSLDAPSPGAVERAATLEKAVALYRDAMAAAAAELAIARAVETLPVEAGRYHAGSVATRALQAMQEAQPYLRAQLTRLEALGLLKDYGAAALRAEAPEEAPKGRKAGRKTKRSGAARKSGPAAGSDKRGSARASKGS